MIERTVITQRVHRWSIGFMMYASNYEQQAKLSRVWSNAGGKMVAIVPARILMSESRLLYATTTVSCAERRKKMMIIIQGV